MAGTPRLFSVNAVMSLLSRFAARSALIHVSEALVSRLVLSLGVTFGFMMSLT